MKLITQSTAMDSNFMVSNIYFSSLLSSLIILLNIKLTLPIQFI